MVYPQLHGKHSKYPQFTRASYFPFAKPHPNNHNMILGPETQRRGSTCTAAGDYQPSLSSPSKHPIWACNGCSNGYICTGKPGKHTRPFSIWWVDNIDYFAMCTRCLVEGQSLLVHVCLVLLVFRGHLYILVGTCLVPSLGHRQAWQGVLAILLLLFHRLLG